MQPKIAKIRSDTVKEQQRHQGSTKVITNVSSMAVKHSKTQLHFPAEE